MAYDGRNNRTSVIDTLDATNSVEYQWAQNNLLSGITVHKDGTKNVEYDYSADSLLESRTENDSTEEFVWDTSRAIPAMLSDGEYEYIYSESRIPLAQVEIETGLVIYLHSDLTGSVTASTGSDGELVGIVDYSPYGKPTGALLSAFGYAGEWVDETTGYSYLKARWLETDTGTFLSEDPLVQMTNNAFGYTEGNPITQIDPLGLMTNPFLGVELYHTDWSEVGVGLSEAFIGTLRNSGNISTGLTFAGLFAAAGGAAPVASALGVASIVFSVGALIYDGGICLGWIQDNGTQCNPALVALDLLGIGSAGFAQMMGRTAISSAAMTGQFALSATSFSAGFTTTAWGLAATAKKMQEENKRIKDEETKKDTCKSSTRILL